MIEIKVEQRSEEWLTLRKGKITGTKLKEFFKSSNLDLIDTLISESHCTEEEDSFTNKAMQRGVDYEPVAKDHFEIINGIEIEEVGFCLSEEYDFLALSPDGFNKDRTIGVEIKCPSTKTHIKYIRMGGYPSEYKYQIFNYFLVNEKLESLYFVSYDDRFPPKPFYQFEIKRESIQDELNQTKEGLEKFWKKYLTYYKEITL